MTAATQQYGVSGWRPDVRMTAAAQQYGVSGWRPNFGELDNMLLKSELEERT